MHIGGNLWEILEREHISVNQLSEKSNIKIRKIEELVKGTATPTLDEFIQIVNALQVSPSELLGEEGSDVREKLRSMDRKVNKISEERKEKLFEEIEIFLDSNHN